MCWVVWTPEDRQQKAYIYIYSSRRIRRGDWVVKGIWSPVRHQSRTHVPCSMLDYMACVINNVPSGQSPSRQPSDSCGSPFENRSRYLNPRTMHLNLRNSKRWPVTRQLSTLSAKHSSTTSKAECTSVSTQQGVVVRSGANPILKLLARSC